MTFFRIRCMEPVLALRKKGICFGFSNTRNLVYFGLVLGGQVFVVVHSLQSRLKMIFGCYGLQLEPLERWMLFLNSLTP